MVRPCSSQGRPRAAHVWVWRGAVPSIARCASTSRRTAHTNWKATPPRTGSSTSLAASWAGDPRRQATHADAATTNTSQACTPMLPAAQPRGHRSLSRLLRRRARAARRQASAPPRTPSGVRLLLDPVRGYGRHSPRDQLCSRQGQPGGRRDAAAYGASRRRARSGVITATRRRGRTRGSAADVGSGSIRAGAARVLQPRMSVAPR